MHYFCHFPHHIIYYAGSGQVTSSASSTQRAAGILSGPASSELRSCLVISAELATRSTTGHLLFLSMGYVCWNTGFGLGQSEGRKCKEGIGKNYMYSHTNFCFSIIVIAPPPTHTHTRTLTYRGG